MLHGSSRQATGLTCLCTRCPLLHSIPRSSSSTSRLPNRSSHARLISTTIEPQANDRVARPRFGLASNERPNASKNSQGRGRPSAFGFQQPDRRTPAVIGSEPEQVEDLDDFNPSRISSLGRWARYPLGPPAYPGDRWGQNRSPSLPIRKMGRSLAQTIDFLKQSRATDTLDQALSKSEEHYSSRHLGKDVDFDKLPSQPRFKDAQRRVVKFHLLNLEENLPLNMKFVWTAFRCPEFFLRTLPRETTPHQRSAPFPEHLMDRSKKAHKSIGLGVVTSKAKLSKLAVERNRARRRVLEALSYVVNRGVMCPPGVNGWELVSEDTSYVFHLYPPSVLLPMDQLCQQVYKSLDTVKVRAAKSGAKWHSRR